MRLLLKLTCYVRVEINFGLKKRMRIGMMAYLLLDLEASMRCAASRVSLIALRQLMAIV